MATIKEPGSGNKSEVRFQGRGQEGEEGGGGEGKGASMGGRKEEGSIQLSCVDGNNRGAGVRLPDSGNNKCLRGRAGGEAQGGRGRGKRSQVGGE